MSLERWGWNRHFAASFKAYDAANYRAGRIKLEHKRGYDLYTELGEITAAVSGRFRHEAASPADFPAVGDWVVWQPQPMGGQGIIHAVLPRISQFSRKAVGRKTDQQIVAANINTVFLVTALDHDFSLGRMERYLVLAWDSGASPVIVLNKADRCSAAQDYQQAMAAIAPGVPIHCLSALQQQGLDQLQPYLQPGQTVALLGSSGVGKSTIVNRLLGRERQAVQAVRANDSKGRHTTTNRELIALPTGGLLIDTPGMRELQVWSTADSLQDTFADLEALATQCRFRDCQHSQEPGCALQDALMTGRLEPRRFDNFQRLQRELRHLARQQDQKALLAEKAHWKTITKQQRQMQRRPFKG